MNKPLDRKIRETIKWLRNAWHRSCSFHRFVAFSTGKDSLALSAMLYEAVGDESPPLLYVHHNLEFPSNMDYVNTLRERKLNITVVKPHLDYFALMERGMGFITLKDPWCIPLLIGTGLFDWLRDQGAASVREAVMFRGMSGSEYSHSLHGRLELYKHLDMPCFNPMLRFSRDEILETIRLRYALPLNPVYRHMNRSYCICCYTSDAKRQLYSGRHFPRVCHKYYRQIEELLFDSGLVDKSCTEERFMSREEKLDRHGFVHWRRAPEQCSVAAVKRHLPSGAVQYVIRDKSLIDLKHLKPLQGRWLRDGNEIRLWDIREKSADTVMRRMLNCVNCGFCMVECFPCRRFDKKKRTLRIEACTECGKCLQLKFCMGWKHRFWRRDIGRKESGR